MRKSISIDNLARRYDNSNIARVLHRMPEQIETALTQSIPKIPAGSFNQVVIVGVGGSAFPADILMDAFTEKLKTSIKIVRYYNLPFSPDDRTLFIISSFSGNTEEPLTITKQLRKFTKNIVVISGGGQLTALANESGYPLVRIPIEIEPDGFQPRFAVGYFMTLLARLLFNAGIMDNPSQELKDVPQCLRNSEIRYEAESVARWLQDKIPIVYTDETHLMSIARIVKIKFNENCKRPAFFNALPEANHNEMIGFTRALATFGILYLHDPDSHPRIIHRYNLMKKIFKRERFKHVSFHMWEIPGKTRIEKIMIALSFADWCSYSLALLDGIDPAPITLVESYKRDLGSFLG